MKRSSVRPSVRPPVCPIDRKQQRPAADRFAAELASVLVMAPASIAETHEW